MKKDLIAATKARALLKNVRFKPMPENVDLITMEDFTEHCRNIDFINSDGTGYYAFEKEVSNKEIKPEDYENFEKGYTHVVWYNR